MSAIPPTTPLRNPTAEGNNGVRRSPRLEQQTRRSEESAEQTNTILNYFVRAMPVLDRSKLDPSQRHCLQVLGWDRANFRVIPDFEAESEVAAKKEKYDDAMKKDEFARAGELHEELEELKKEVSVAKAEVEVASRVSKEAANGFEYAVQQKDFGNMSKWKELMNASTRVLTEYHEHLEEEKANSRKKQRTSRNSSAAVVVESEEEEGEDSLESLPEQEDNPFGMPQRHTQSRPRKTKQLVGNKRKKPSERIDNGIKDDAELNRVLDIAWKSKENGMQKDRRGQSLRRESDQLYCGACVKFVNKRNATNHLNAISHAAKLLIWKKRTEAKQVTLKEMEEKRDPRKTLSNELVLYRKEVLKSTYIANMTMGQLEAMRKYTIDKNNQPGLTVGPTCELARTYNAELLKDEREAAIAIIGRCYPEFGTTSDGTPTFAKAEGILIRLVDQQTMEIKEILLSVRLFQRGPSGEELAGNLVDVLTKQYNLKLRNWRVAMLDRASTNIKCIKDVCEQTEADVTRAPCNSHSLCKPGEAFDAPEAEKWRQSWNSGIVHKGKAAEECKKLFNITPQSGGGIRWYHQWEQIAQLVEQIGLVKIMKQHVPVCVKNEWSKASMDKLVKLGSPDKLPKLTVQMASIAEAGRPFCESTYMLEGKDPLALTAYLVFERLDAKVEQLESQEAMPLTKEACKQASEMIQALMKPLQDAITSIENEILDERLRLVAAKENVLEERGALQRHQAGPRRAAAAGASRTSARNVPARSYQRMSRGVDEEEDTVEARLNDSIQHLETLVNEIEQRVTCLEERKLEPEETLLDCVESFDGLYTEEEFLKHAKSVVQPAIAKYRAIFEAEGGDHVELRKAMNACRIFDPFFLATTDIEALRLLADDLACFGNGFPEFQKADFIDKLKAELPNAVEHAKKQFDWDAIEGSKLYDDRAKKRNLRAQKRVRESQLGQHAETIPTPTQSTGRECTFENWKKDPGERARRIYYWWRTRFVSSKTTFKYFLWALRLIVLLQASSAEIERVFSQLTMIIRVCGSSLLEESLELRTMLRYNKGLGDDE
jgi:hypothetical protein